MIRLLVDPIVSAYSVMELDHVSASKIIKEIRTRAVVLNVFWVRSVRLTKLVSEINARIHAQEFAVWTVRKIQKDSFVCALR